MISAFDLEKMLHTAVGPTVGNVFRIHKTAGTPNWGVVQSQDFQDLHGIDRLDRAVAKALRDHPIIDWSEVTDQYDGHPSISHWWSEVNP